MDRKSLKKLRAPSLKTLISAPWGKASVNSYYGDPSFANGEQRGIEHLDRDRVDEDGSECVVIKGYN